MNIFGSLLKGTTFVGAGCVISEIGSTLSLNHQAKLSLSKLADFLLFYADLSEAVHTSVVFDLFSTRHHHASLDCIDGVGNLEQIHSYFHELDQCFSTEVPPIYFTWFPENAAISTFLNN